MRLPALIAVASVLLIAGCGGGGGDRAPTTVGEHFPDRQIRVIDADTVEIDGTRYRLHGIDAPERYQRCRAWGRTWACGAAATEALASRAEGMVCEGGDADRHGRTIGTCFSGGEDLNAWLVAQGWALAYRQYAEDYASQEDQARSNRRGIHRGGFVAPWDWRRGERLGGEDTFAAIASAEIEVGALADRMLRGDHANIYGRSLDDSVFVIVDDAVAVSFGSAAGTNPTVLGGAFWEGDMVGMDTRIGERIAGASVIEIDDLAMPEVSVLLTGIEDSRGHPRQALHWENLPMTRGAFEAEDTTSSVEGQFYGKSHQEVGGIFRHDQLIGAFGGSR